MGKESYTAKVLWDTKITSINSLDYKPVLYKSWQDHHHYIYNNICEQIPWAFKCGVHHNKRPSLFTSRSL